MSGARLVNHTIDDDLGDSVTGLRPTYSPADGWIRNEAPSGVSLDTSRIVNGTWHQASGLGERSVSVTFTGVAVYVNLIIVRSMPPTLQETNLTFTLDPSAGPDADKTVDLQLPNLGTGGPLYSWEAYGVSRLPFRPHTLLISTVGATNSLFLFDSIRYVVEESDLPESAATRPSVTASSTQTSLSPSTGIPNTSVTSLQNGSDPTTTSTVSSHDQSTGPSASVGPIIGGVVGVVLAVAILIAVLLFRRRRTRRSSELREDIEPFNTGSENRNSPSVLPAPVRHVNPSETPFGETRALAPNKMVQRIAPGTLRNELSSHPRLSPNALGLLGSSETLGNPPRGREQSRASIVGPAKLSRRTPNDTLPNVERMAHLQIPSNDIAEHVNIVSDRTISISGHESGRAQDGSVLPSAEPHTQTSREDPPKPRVQRGRKSPNVTPSDSLPRNAARPTEATPHDQESPPPFTSSDVELPRERERLLHLALPWSLGQRILALMGTGIARAEGGTEGDGQDTEPPPAYEPRHLNTDR